MARRHESTSRIRRTIVIVAGLCGVLQNGAWAGPKYEREIDLPPRLQWNANSGYCGETSFISAGLFYGQYCSQYEARAIASPGVPQSNPNSQLLLGANDVSAAAAMRLTAIPWNTARQRNTREFLAWTKSQLLAGYPVIIGIFTNEYRFYSKLNPNAGDPQYDHIVPVVAMGSNRPLEAFADRYFGADVITFSDNGLWSPSGTPSFIFSYRFDEFQKNRRQANKPRGAIYALNNNGQNYGIAITGVADRDGDTIPVRLVTEGLMTNVNSELPEMVDGSNRRPEPGFVTLWATCTIPDSSVEYKLYRYDNFADVPEKAFNANADKAVESWDIPVGALGFTVIRHIVSSDVVIFRAVKASAP